MTHLSGEYLRITRFFKSAGDAFYRNTVYIIFFILEMAHARYIDSLPKIFKLISRATRFSRKRERESARWRRIDIYVCDHSCIPRARFLKYVNELYEISRAIYPLISGVLVRVGMCACVLYGFIIYRGCVVMEGGNRV